MTIDCNASSQLVRIDWMIEVNEEIKKVSNLTFGVNLVALNAMLVAKSAGERSRGFGVVSSELRMFSGKLRETMQTLALRIFDLVNGVAQMQKHSRELDRMRTAEGMIASMHEHMVAPLLRKELVLAQFTQSINKDQDQLLREVRRTLQLCDWGSSLARSAKIESVYGGEMADTLKQVAAQIEDTIEEILNTLNALEMRLLV
ncbi:MAG: hypothetical protein R8K20_08300 [Gallionellaceae bacterium]